MDKHQLKILWHSVFAGLFLFSGCAIAREQVPKENSQDVAGKAKNPHRNYLLDLLTAEEVLPKISVAHSIKSEQKQIEFQKKHSASLQMLATHRAFAGDVQGAIAAFDLLYTNGTAGTLLVSEGKDLPENVVALDALKAIVDEAKNRRIVILNEAHHVPMHRAFAMRLARELRKIGYSYLACETFEDDDPMSRGFVEQRTGYYSNEGVFAEFLRDAARSGWKFVSYEPFTENQTRLGREIGQAENLVNKVLKRDPNAKVFVYVGYSHALKAPAAVNTTDFAWMAAQLKRLSGIEPLSIDQATMYAHSAMAAEHPFYRKALARFQSTQPFVMRNGSGGYEVFGKYRAGMDMPVFHPPYGTAHFGRADWLWSLAERRAVPVPQALMPQSGRRLLLAFHEDDEEEAVPIDAVLVNASDVPKAFALPAGRFRFSYQVVPKN